PKLVKKLDLSAEARYKMQRHIALLFAQDQMPEAVLWFARLDHSRIDAYARAWEIRAIIYQRRWPLAVDAIRNLPASQASEEVWRYWLGRALAETGHNKKARQILSKLAGHR